MFVAITKYCILLALLTQMMGEDNALQDFPLLSIGTLYLLTFWWMRYEKKNVETGF